MNDLKRYFQSPEGKWSRTLNLPDNMAAYCLIPAVYPLGNFGPVTRKLVEDVMRWDQWSGTKLWATLISKRTKIRNASVKSPTFSTTDLST